MRIRARPRLFSVKSSLAVAVLLFLLLGTSLSLLTIPPVHAATTLLNDNFTQDNSLNVGYWTVNGAAALATENLWCAGGCNIINPTLSFSSQNGMQVSGVNALSSSAAIQSVQSFSAPFTAQAVVEGTIAHGNPFVFAIASQDGGQGVSMWGNLNSTNTPYYGIDEVYATGSGNLWQPTNLSIKIVQNPQFNVLYTLGISVDASGLATLSVSAGQTVLGTVSQQVGTGMFYILLAQVEGAPVAGGPGNVANWQSVTVTSPSTPLSVTVSPTSDSIILGQAVYFAASPIGGTGSYSDYTWNWIQQGTTNQGSFDSGTSVDYDFTPANAGTYLVYVTATDSSGTQAQSIGATITVAIVTGVQNTVTISDYTISNSGGVVDDCSRFLDFIPVTSCFSIQQNFFVYVPGQGNAPTYWVQNVVIVGSSPRLGTVIWTGYDVFNGNQQPPPLSNCVSNFKHPITPCQRFAVPVDLSAGITLTSEISNGGLLFSTKSSSGTISYALPTSDFGSIGLPPGSQIGTILSPGITGAFQPQLVIVAACCSAHVVFKSATGTVQSFVQLSGGTFEPQVTLSKLSCQTSCTSGTGTSAGESSENLLWNPISATNEASFEYQKGALGQGIGFSPSMP